VRDTAAFLAELRGESLEQLARDDHSQFPFAVYQGATRRGCGMKLLMLGSGTSTGVPRIGNDWGECDPAEPRNRRTRVSIMVENDAGQRILIDTSTDLRQQLLANRDREASMRCCGRTTTPITATASMICA
jgi:hypothetical protein